MTLSSPLTRLLAVVIVMIAAVFGASAAQAHEGHAHHTPAAVKVSHAATKAAALPAKAVQAVNAATTARVLHTPVAVTALAVGGKAVAQVPAQRPCNGVCCSMGASCCAPGLLPEITFLPQTLTVGSRLVFSEQSAAPSIAREALPKPPRSFA